MSGGHENRAAQFAGGSDKNSVAQSNAEVQRVKRDTNAAAPRCSMKCRLQEPRLGACCSLPPKDRQQAGSACHPGPCAWGNIARDGVRTMTKSFFDKLVAGLELSGKTPCLFNY